MATVNYTLISDERGRSLTVYIDKDGEFETHVLASSNAAFAPVLDYLINTDPDDYDVDWIESQVNVLQVVGSRLTAVSERVRVTDSDLLFDGDPLRNALSDHIVRAVRDGDTGAYTPLVSFLEKVSTNPSQDSVESIYAWLSDRKFAFTPDGDFIAYKGVRVDADGVSESILEGKAIVNGVIQKGHIKNPDGAVIEMPRSEVTADSSIGCGPGLHAGTYEYAKNFAKGRVLVVKINPRDVVSVPSDHSFQKLRVSRYVVLSTIEQEYRGTTYTDTSWDEDDEYDDDDYWGDGDDEY